jgi:predicted nucleic-acid-binding protein
MIGLDANILVRYLAQADAVQSHKATQIIERSLTEEEPGFISLVTMVETVWVLDRIYGLPAQKTAAAIERVLQADTLVIQNEQEVFTAMMMLRVGRESFSDALIGALGALAGCASTLTFDRKAARLALLPAREVAGILVSTGPW